MRKMKRVAMGASPPTSSYPVGEEAKVRIKYQNLLQDYKDLLKETKAKNRRLQKAKEKKLRLSTEVKFLRKKYKSFMKNPSRESSYRLKKQQAHKASIPSSKMNPSQNRVIQADFSPKDKNCRIRESGIVSTSAVLDLNQAFYPNVEDMEEFQVEQEHVKMEKPKRSSMEGEVVANDLKLSICREVGTSSNHMGKRKISWQDQVALRV
ncbi:hypothetical protein J5N97_003251 [Dioscorea zingiberensis]|uniref:Uncharacterized protein n=1 Tax=Dioscorea zingiberensis TaxID=325984 RepID=A0A9D5D6C4_9LILI|nr:hypothetical protein J5N97_003251 [Dioscorea zingiberensis]